MSTKQGLIIGGSGALGSSVVSVFRKHGWRMLNIDLKPNEQADSNFVLDSNRKIQT